MSKVYTYNPKQTKIAVGNHIVTGYDEDNFITIEPAGDGTTMKVGCDGEVNRAISVNEAYNVKIALLQNSPSNAYLRTLHKRDKEEGTGIFPITVKDIMGEQIFTSESCWVSKEPSWQRGRETSTVEWELQCAWGEFRDGE